MVPVTLYEFVSADSPSLFVVTAHAARIAAAALACCREWVFRRQFLLGDRTLSAELEASIRNQIAEVGYQIFVNRSPAPS